MLTEIIKNKSEIIINTKYKIFPDIDNREFWDKAKESSLPFFNKMREMLGENPRQLLTASMYREYKINGNRINFEAAYFSRRSELLIKTFLECFHNDGKYLEDITDLVWMILEESTWCVPAHEVKVKEADFLPDFNRQTLDLFSAETSSLMAFVYQVMGDRLDGISSVLKRRIKDRVNSFVFDEYLRYNDYWWMGFTGEMSNNWCPWINSNIINSAIILADSEEKLREILYKAITSIDTYIKNQPIDGGCDEGASYWNCAGLTLLEGLWLLKNVTDGQIDCFKEEQIINVLEYFMKLYTGNGECINFADGNTKLPVYYASVFKFAKLTSNEKMIKFSKALYDDVPYFNIADKANRRRGVRLTRVLRFFDVAAFTEEISNLKNDRISDSDYYIESINVMTSSKEGNPQNGLYIAAKGGHNDESHNHNDVGHFCVYKNGEKFLIDIGNMTYSAITFSDKRYTLFTTRSAYHNVPLINGCEQRYGNEYRAKNVTYKNENNIVTFSLDISDAYENKEAINKWIREIKYNKESEKISVSEEFSLKKEMEYELHFITPCLVEEADCGLRLTSKNGEVLNIDYDKKNFETIIDYIDTDDEILNRDWGKRIYRISLRGKSKEDKINYIIY